MWSIFVKEQTAFNLNLSMMELERNMKKTDCIESNALLERIARHLIVYSNKLHSHGLFHGKMGVVIFMCHYSRYTNNILYDRFAEDILDEILEVIHDAMPINFENGLCGIGWGIEYLAQNGFIGGDTNNILFDIDEKIMEWDPLRISDIEFKTGLAGILHYATTRLTSPKRGKGKLPFDSLYLSELFQRTQSIQTVNSEPLLATIALRYKNSFKDGLIEQTKPVWDQVPLAIPQGKDITNWPLGLYNGSVGVGLNLILQ